MTAKLDATAKPTIFGAHGFVYSKDAEAK